MAITGNAKNGPLRPTPQTAKVVAKAKEFIKQTPGFSSTIQGPPSPQDLKKYYDLYTDYNNSFTGNIKAGDYKPGPGEEIIFPGPVPAIPPIPKAE